MTFRTDLAARAATLRPMAPGIGLALTVAAAASFLGAHYGAPVMLFALLIGMAFNFLAEDARFALGIGVASKTILRTGVALLGFRLTLGDLGALGLPAVLGVLGLVALTIGSGFVFARALGRGWRFAVLTGGSVAICGASAALALAAIIPANDKLERNTLFTVVGVTALSTVAMIAYPILFSSLGLDDRAIGFLIGATIHDVAQVVGAGFSVSETAGETATLVKLLRVTLLPVVLILLILALKARAAEAGEGARPGLPAFVIAFGIFMAMNSTGVVPERIVGAAVDLSRVLLVTAIAALGVKTSLKAMTAVGGGHVVILVLETLLLLVAASALVWSGLLGL